MSIEPASRLARRLPWEQADLVEGTEALLWPAGDERAADREELPEPSAAVHAVLSWVRPKVLRFETPSPEPLAELLLVSTQAVDGPAQFVVRKSYQLGNTAVCDPPRRIQIVDRRDLFRVPVAVAATVGSAGETWSCFTLDCSVGGVRICPADTLTVGTEVEVTLELDVGATVVLPGVVRHCHPIVVAKASPAGGGGANGTHGGAANGRTPGPFAAGLQFLEVPAEVERQLSQFVGRHQRRLMPRVRAMVPLEYCSHGRQRYIEAFATEMSPGDVVLALYEHHVPGDRMEVRFRLGRKDYHFKACTVACHQTGGEDGEPLRYIARACLDLAADAVEAEFRNSLRDMAVDGVSRRASARPQRYY